MFGIMRSGRSLVCAMQTPPPLVGDIIICVCECVCVCVRMRFSVLGCAWERWHVCLVAGPRIAGDMTATERNNPSQFRAVPEARHCPTNLWCPRLTRFGVAQRWHSAPVGHLQLGHRFHFITTVPPRNARCECVMLDCNALLPKRDDCAVCSGPCVSRKEQFRIYALANVWGLGTCVVWCKCVCASVCATAW